MIATSQKYGKWHIGKCQSSTASWQIRSPERAIRNANCLPTPVEVRSLDRKQISSIVQAGGHQSYFLSEKLTLIMKIRVRWWQFWCEFSQLRGHLYMIMSHKN